MAYRRGEVFLANLNPAKGSEPGKLRPVVIIQSDAFNEVDYPTCIVIPCSSQKMPLSTIRPALDEDFFEKKTYALLDQVRAIDVSKRLVKKLGILSDKNLKILENNLFRLLN